MKISLLCPALVHHNRKDTNSNEGVIVMEEVI